MPNPPPPYPALRRHEQAVILAVAVFLFLFWDGPIWARFADWNASILWSYLSIPLLVLGLLAWRRRVHALPWLLHSLEIAAVKFGITAAVLVAVMFVRGSGPTFRARASVTNRAAVPAVAPVPRVMAPDPYGGTLEGSVTGPGWVWLTGLSEPLTQLPPSLPVEFTERGDGFSPPFVVALVGQPLQVHSEDGRLHTARLFTGTEQLFNIPVPAEGKSPARAVERPADAELACAVHGKAERSARVLFLPHPFFVRAQANGSFRIAQIPPGAYTVRSRGQDGSEGPTAPATVRAGEILHLDLGRSP